MISPLFSPFTLRGMSLKNRIVLSPMLMYMAGEDGRVNDRHFVHYGARALGGTGLVMTEVVAVTPRGVLRFGIPRRLDGQLRMEIQHRAAFPGGLEDARWSLEEVR